ncbi:MAG TPA: hypothetical protein VJ464_07750 [Blastocatellia bacterium]|nr:hypothetical protein [Blastocatellia bacterium]
MPTPGEIADRAVAIACATTSGFVKIQKLDPLIVSPAGLSELAFQDVGIVNDAQIQAFIDTLAHLLPELAGGIMQITASPSTVIGDVADLLTDLIAKP